MTRNSRRTDATKPPPKANATEDALESIWPIPGAGLNAPSAIDAVRRMSDLQMGISQFAAERIRKNVATAAAVATCRTPLDFLELWRTAAAETVSDYAEEAARILEIQRI